jgi:hypothetical protein
VWDSPAWPVFDGPLVAFRGSGCSQSRRRPAGLTNVVGGGEGRMQKRGRASTHRHSLTARGVSKRRASGLDGMGPTCVCAFARTSHLGPCSMSAPFDEHGRARGSSSSSSCPRHARSSFECSKLCPSARPPDGRHPGWLGRPWCTG